MLKLTRFLYMADEVKQSLIASVLKKRDLTESYYWLFELYYSEINVFPILWELYFDYYAIKHPKFEEYMIEKQTKWEKDKNIGHLHAIIANLYKMDFDANVFLLRQLTLSTELFPTLIIKGRIPINIKHFEPPFHALLNSVRKHAWNNICYYIVTLIRTYSAEYILSILTAYYTASYTITTAIEYINRLFVERKYGDNVNAVNNVNTNQLIHHLIKFICQMELNYLCENLSTTSLEFSKSNAIEADIDDIIETISVERDPIPLNKNGSCSIYRTLLYKRNYIIDDQIGSFQLERYKHDNYRREILNHWEYYASSVGLWHKRMLNATIQRDTKTIEFADDNEQEEFYEKYGYELDEQPKNVQDCSLLEIEKRDYMWWFDYISVVSTACMNVKISAGSNVNATMNNATSLLNEIGTGIEIPYNFIMSVSSE